MPPPRFTLRRAGASESTRFVGAQGSPTWLLQRPLGKKLLFTFCGFSGKPNLISNKKWNCGSKMRTFKTACPGKWSQGLKNRRPISWWFNFDPYPKISTQKVQLEETRAGKAPVGFKCTPQSNSADVRQVTAATSSGEISDTA